MCLNFSVFLNYYTRQKREQSSLIYSYLHRWQKLSKDFFLSRLWISLKGKFVTVGGEENSPYSQIHSDRVALSALTDSLSHSPLVLFLPPTFDGYPRSRVRALRGARTAVGQRFNDLQPCKAGRLGFTRLCSTRLDSTGSARTDQPRTRSRANNIDCVVFGNWQRIYRGHSSLPTQRPQRHYRYHPLWEIYKIIIGFFYDENER